MVQRIQKKVSVADKAGIGAIYQQLVQQSSSLQMKEVINPAEVISSINRAQTLKYGWDKDDKQSA